MKKSILIVMVLTLIMSVSIFPAKASNISNDAATTKAERNDDSQRIAPQYNRTVKYHFSDFNRIPTYIYFREYDEIAQTWFNGSLSLISVIREYSNGRVVWKATYSGTLTGNI